MHSDATALANAIRSGDLTASEEMKVSLNKLEEHSSLGSVVYTDSEKGLQAADEFDKALKCKANNIDLKFGGVPTLAKDLGGPFKGFPTRAGSNVIPKNSAGEADSILADRFRASGSCLFGLTTSTEFGLSLASEPVIGLVCRNPLNSDLSAGGAAAAVACCGLVGLKSSRGAIPGGPSFGNHLGGIASELAVCRSVRDTASIFSAVAGDARGPFPPVEHLPLPDGKLKIGLITDTGTKHPTAYERSNVVKAAAKFLEANGHKVISIDWVTVAHMTDASARVFAGIITANLEELENATDWDFSKSELITQAAIECGQSITGVELWQLMNEMILVSCDLWQLFDAFDCLLTPMLSTAPKPIGFFPTDHADINSHFDRMTAFSPLATLANISGFPALTMPFGADAEGLPLPIQILAPMGCEKLLLSLAARLETELRWQHKFSIAGLDQ